MNRLEIVEKKIEQIEKLLAEIRVELEALDKERDAKPTRRRQREETSPSDAELRSEYNRLYQEFLISSSAAVEQFVRRKNKTYLKAFCRANDLPVDTSKVSKSRIADVIAQWMAQRKAITQKAT